MSYEFEARPWRVVALRFTGGEESARDIIDWVKGYGATGFWTKTSVFPKPETDRDRKASEGLRITHDSIIYGDSTLSPGDWIVRDEKERIRVYRDEDFRHLYRSYYPENVD